MATRRYKQADGSGVAGGVRRQRGSFTLIELLVVIAIIVVLISILMPSLRKSVREARSTVCAHNLKQIGIALDAYRVDNNGWVPATEGSNGESDENGLSQVWFQQLVPSYLSNPAVLTCPEDPLRSWLLGANGCNPHDLSVASSYGMNKFILASPDQFLCHFDRFRSRWPLTTLLVGDVGPDVLTAGQSSMIMLDEANRTDGSLPWDDGFEPGDPDPPMPWITVRHLGGMNILMRGLNVKKVSTQSLIGEPIQSYYPVCAGGGCTLCLGHSPFDGPVAHYSFAASQVFWWTGNVPTP